VRGTMMKSESRYMGIATGYSLVISGFRRQKNSHEFTPNKDFFRVSSCFNF